MQKIQVRLEFRTQVTIIAQPKPMRDAVKLVLFAIFLTFVNSKSNAGVMDNGVDPANLGTGDWIYFLRDATNRLGGNVESVTNVTSLMKYYRKTGFDFISVKAGTGGDIFPTAANPQFTRELVHAAHKAGLKIFGYSRSDGKDVPAEVALAATVYELGADGFIIDAEAEWESSRLGDKGPELAVQLCTSIKKRYPNKFLGHSPMPIISKHSSFPYKEFGLYCDAVLPQAYWTSIGVSPKRMVEWMDEEWRTWQASLKGDDRRAIKPLAPVAQGWSPSASKTLSGKEIVEFVDALNEDKQPASITGYKSVSYWRSDLHTQSMWHGIRHAKIGERNKTPFVPSPEDAAPPVATADNEKQQEGDFVLDDSQPEVSLSGAWLIGKQNHGFYGTNYVWATTVTGNATATAVYRPEIAQSGEYDIYIMYLAHQNRSRKAPWFVSCSTGTEIVEVDETIEAGGWRLIATGKPFIAGSEGYISVSNDTDEQSKIVIADAVRFVRRQPQEKDAGK